MQMFPFGLTAVVTSKQLIEELRTAPDDALSFDGLGQVVCTRLAHVGCNASYILLAQATQTKYTMGTNPDDERIHVPVVRSTLTRHLAALFGDIVDEMIESVRDALPSHASGGVYPWDRSS
jgi:hypothetical protein